MRGMPEGADSGCHPDWVESGKKLPSELGLGPCEALAALPALDMALSAMRGSAGSLNPDWGAALHIPIFFWANDARLVLGFSWSGIKSPRPHAGFKSSARPGHGPLSHAGLCRVPESRLGRRPGHKG